ncbi:MULTISPECIES: helix-turn-helix domain-containing protein [Winogradskyella]|uniref:Helix-turn-helix domain-containing protein n=1 Tax=Winogradskyella ouciana TaxID=2608631 RepID=A0A7K1GED9_9FLAO|nr:helix-turn-helix domain-containing protein [Winogradskyella ouciana]MTE27461.1 helix-turn-helix domain-containing protein [Winogradskyella ouciana]
MTLKYYKTDRVSSLVEEFFHLTFDDSDLPFESTVLPVCSTAITFIFKNQHRFIYKKKETELSGLIVTGQFYESFQFLVEEKGHSFGMMLHPTTLYKLTKLDVSKIKNKHVLLDSFSKELHNLLNTIFIEHESDIPKLVQNLKQAILKLPNENDSVVDIIDGLIAHIHSKEGMLNTYDLLAYVDFSQKTLETHFKNIVGLTPGRYIRLYRFVKLMRKYESNTIKLKDLIYMYNYYDRSHFTRDFKHFMKQSPKDYFKTEHPFLNKYLNK